MKKFFITLNPQTPTGYQFVTKHDDGHEDIVSIDKITHDGKSVILPASDCGRQYWAISKIKADVNEIPAKDATVSSVGSQSKPKVSLAELSKYLTSTEDKAMWQELSKKIEHAKLIAKAKAEYEAAKAKYESMKGSN